MDKLLTLEDIKNIPIQNLMNLYREGYELENSPKYGTADVTFIVANVAGYLDQAAIFVDNEYKGITDLNGTLTVKGLSAGTIAKGHDYFIIRSGYNLSGMPFLLFPNLDIIIPVILTRSTGNKGAIRFYVISFGRPCPDAHVFLRGSEIGVTGQDGILLAEDLDPGIDIPYKVSKIDFKDADSTVEIIDRATIDEGIILIPSDPFSGKIDFLTIYETGDILSGVSISIDDENKGTTDIYGHLIVDNLEIGTIEYKYLAYKKEYIIQTGNTILVTGYRLIPIIMSKE